VGTLWILLTDTLLKQLVSSSEILVQISIWKGFLFVITTAILIHFLVSRALHAQKDSASRLKASEARLRQLVEGNDEYAFIMLDPAGAIISWSSGAERMTGYRIQDIAGRSISTLYPAEEVTAQAPQRALAQAAAEGYFGEEAYRVRKDGSLFIINMSLRPLLGDGGNLTGFSSICRDVTEQKLAQNKISHLNRLYALLSRVNTTIVRVKNRQDLFNDICRAVVDDGSFPAAWIGLADRETQRVVPAAWHGSLEGYLEGLTVTLDDTPTGQGPIGSVIRSGVSFICNDIENNPRMAPWRDAALSQGFRSVTSLPIRLREKILGTLTIYSGESFFFDADEITLLEEVADDISFALHTMEEEQQRRKAEDELQHLNEELEERVRQRTADLELANSELESFNYSISHDLRSPLTVINGFSQTLTEECPLPDEKCHFYVERIKAATNRMAKLIDDLLNLTRVNRKVIQLTPIDLSSMAVSVAQELRMRSPGHNVDFSVTGELQVDADPSLMRLALLNLLGNAWKYSSHQENPRVELGATVHDGRSCFYVRDNGVGFNMKYSDKLFKPFERLHSLEDFEGSGIGLATVKRILNRHGGTAWAEAAPGEGATFYFTLS
jgi:PAS domain S-box-containing protein